MPRKKRTAGEAGLTSSARGTDTGDKGSKAKKRRIVNSPSSIFLVKEGGAGTIPDAQSPTARTPLASASVLLPPRDEQCSTTLVPSRDYRSWYEATRIGDDRVAANSRSDEARSTLELLGHVQLPEDTPAEEILMALHREFNNDIPTMYALRVSAGLPTGLKTASMSVRAATCGSAALESEAESETRAAEQSGRLPPLSALSAASVAKTRVTCLPAGRLTHAHGYTSDQSKQTSLRVHGAYTEDRLRREAEFFKDDLLEGEDASRPHGLRPEDYAIYHRLRREHADQFHRMDDYFDGAAMNVPRTQLEEVTRSYLEVFRFPPRGEAYGERACPKGEHCQFMLAAIRKGEGRYGYVGREFLLPSELDAYAATGKLPEQVGLCYDCTIESYTQHVFRAQAHRVEQSKPINRFTVSCASSGISAHFSKNDMLPPIINKTPTGIVGFVPRYSISRRKFADARHPQDPEGIHRAKPVHILADISPSH